MNDFFISYNRKDKSWAEWIADTLENKQYSVSIQAWHFLPGSNFVVEMQRATVECKKTIAVLSPDYLASMFTQAEWAVAFSVDPSGSGRKLIPVRVRVCEPPGLLGAIVYSDLVGLNEAGAREALIGAVSGTPPRPANSIFPGTNLLEPGPADVEMLHDEFPGCKSAVPLDKLPAQITSAVDLLGLLRTTRTTFEAQARLRDELVQRVQERLVLDPYMQLQYQEFFSRYFECFEPYERNMFATIRSFTSSVLYEYNKKVLRLIETNSVLERRIDGISALKNHLLLWLAKCDRVFTSTPEMCLVYVGVDEGVPFPAEVEGNIWSYLKEQGETDALLLAEPPPRSEFEERASPDQSWRPFLRDRWLLKEISETNSKLVEERDETALRELDNTLATKLREALYPAVSFEDIRQGEEIFNAVKSIVDAAQPDWPKELLSVLTKAKSVLSRELPLHWGPQFALESYLFDLVPLLPTLVFEDEKRNPQTILKQLWKSVREDLIAAAIRRRSRQS